MPSLNIVWADGPHHIRKYRDGSFAAYRVEPGSNRDKSYTLLGNAMALERAIDLVKHDAVVLRVTAFYFTKLQPTQETRP